MTHGGLPLFVTLSGVALEGKGNPPTELETSHRGGFGVICHFGGRVRIYVFCLLPFAAWILFFQYYPGC